MRILKALTKRAQIWIDQNVICNDWQLVAGGVAGDWRCINAIEEAMLNEDFRQTRRWWQFWKPIDFQII